MSRGGDSSQWTAEQTLSYIKGLITVADDNEDDQTIYTALSIAYEYLVSATRRKITWSLSLEKLAYEFIDLAFETNLHASVKDIFKSYRAITQGQYSESLKCVLDHYRDQKLQHILEEEIKKEDIPLIRALPNIDTEEPSPEIILESMDSEKVKREMHIRSKLKIVWEGYKSIVETVRVNQKLQDVYMDTLKKIFDFVDRYNRVQEFKSFCRSLRTGLQNAFSKRDKAEQQKAIYIDIEKTDVNTRNIEIRMEQFKITTKLGLWGESFLVLQDINTLMRVRRAPLKNSLRCQYYQNLALLFSKNSFWHYHAFAFYNYYLAYLTKPKITTEEKMNLSDRLLLSILVIPAVTVESQQSKEIQQKLSSMMISSTKVPERSQLVELMVSKGVLENASPDVRELWNFMFLEFRVNSLKQGLEFVAKIKQTHPRFKELIQASLINKQLISIAQFYQRIRISSLERLIPLPLPQIKKMLILAHREKLIDFTFDQSQGIIVFQDQAQQVNPSEEFHHLFMHVALASEGGRILDETHIRRKTDQYLKNAQHDIWTIRQYKIQEFKKKMKEPMMELWKKELLKKKELIQQKERQQAERKARQMEVIRKNEEAQKILATKKIIINDIITIKENRVVRIMEKKIENLTDQQIDNLSLEALQQHLENTKKKITNNKEARLKKAFTHIDYLQRERRNLLTPKIEASLLSAEEEKQLQHQCVETAKKNYHDHNEHRARIQNLAKFYKDRIKTELQTVYSQFDKGTEQYNTRINENFRAKIIARAQQLLEQNEKKKEMQLKQQQELLKSIQTEEYNNGMWSFKKKEAPVAAPTFQFQRRQEPAQSTSTSAATAPTNTIRTHTNPFERLEGVGRQEETSNKKWGIGSKINNQTEKKPVAEPIREVKQESKATQKPKDEKKWAFGSKKAEEKPAETVSPVVAQKKTVFTPPPPTTENKGKWGATEKKEEKKPTQPSAQPAGKKGKGW